MTQPAKEKKRYEAPAIKAVDVVLEEVKLANCKSSGSTGMGSNIVCGGTCKVQGA